MPRPTPPRRPASRPLVESLEGRALLAAYAPVDPAGLIAAVAAANASPGPDTITLAAGRTYTLTAADNTTDGPTGLPVIAAGEDLTVVGNGATIARRAAAGRPAFRLLDVAAGGSLTLRNLTLKGGLATALPFGPDPAEGGAVRSAGALTMTNVTVRDSLARGFDLHSAIWGPTTMSCAAGGGVWSAGTLVMTDCAVLNDAAVGGHGIDGYYYSNSLSGDNYPVEGEAGGYAVGGGVCVAGGTAALTRTALTGNTAQGGGGGYGYDSRRGGGAGGAGSGGGVCATAGTLTLTNVTATTNRAAGGAGGIPGVNARATSAGRAGQGVGGGVCIGRRAAARIDLFSVIHITGDTASTSADDLFGTYVSIP